ncbi:hypothetical protein, partial [Burkholderia pseudomallei]|uniref:hypothetical protein n=1 Tax=Burkholderia pseudomallei TaxID=28450 RepID=UPI001E504A14
MRQLVADVQRLQAVCRLKSLIGIKFEALLCDSGRRGGVTRLRQFTAPRQCGRGAGAAGSPAGGCRQLRSTRMETAFSALDLARVQF